MTTFVCQKQLPALQKIQTMASKTAAYSSWCPISIIRCLHFRPAGHLWHPISWPKKHKYAEQLQIAFCSNESNHMQRVKKICLASYWKVKCGRSVSILFFFQPTMCSINAPRSRHCFENRTNSGPRYALLLQVVGEHFSAFKQKTHHGFI